FLINDFWLNAVAIPFFAYTMAAMGLNILTGYCGQVSLGTGGFLATGAYAAYKITTAFPELNLIFVFLAAGFITAAAGLAFGIPSLRIKGFYLAVATLAAQFFIVWLVTRVPWFSNYNASGQIQIPTRTILGYPVTGGAISLSAQYLFALTFVAVFAVVAKNLSRTGTGRGWMAIRDMDIAAELIGIRPLFAKLSAFAVSSFYIGIAGAMMFALWLSSVEPNSSFGINQSFLVLFMIIIGGLGTVLGSFFGAAFLVLLPLFLSKVLVSWLGMVPGLAKDAEILVMGVLIVFFLIVEPGGLARMWQTAREKLRLWPFPY
ncbi:MAG TPA: branched-chain amino acid ABC transporter permease, partial [Hyphomicrobiales bacterium]|nr:branched-chain amino acid ABC transporter permease [Hyphomicrobiales bacterium]